MKKRKAAQTRRVPVTVPVFAYPKKDPEHPCPCQDRPVELSFKACLLFWERDEGARVEAGEVLALIEAEKMTVELLSPAAGTLTARCIDEGARCEVGETAAYIEAEP